jgi:uncharacterized membrane protein YbhN (UPF0104 family)
MAILTPGKVGDIGRAFYFRDKVAELTGLIVFEKITDLFSYLTLSIAMALALRTEFGLLLVLVSLMFFGLITKPDVFYGAVIHRLPSFLRDKACFARVGADFGPIRSRSHFLILQSFLITTLNITQFHIILNAFASVKFSISCLVFPFSILLASIPVSFGGLGVREGAMIVLLSMFYVPEETAMNASLFYYLAHILPFMAGVLCVPKLFQGFKEWLCSLELFGSVHSSK